jgi:hypothetical protein
MWSNKFGLSGVPLKPESRYTARKCWGRYHKLHQFYKKFGVSGKWAGPIAGCLPARAKLARFALSAPNSRHFSGVRSYLHTNIYFSGH